MKNIIIAAILGISLFFNSCASNIEELPRTEELLIEPEDVAEEKIKIEKRTDIQQEELAEILEGMLPEQVIAHIRIFPFPDETSMQILVKDENIDYAAFTYLAEICDYFSEQISNSGQIELYFCDPFSWNYISDKADGRDFEPQDYWELADSARFILDTGILPQALELESALLADYSRKQDLFTTLGDLASVGDTDVVTEIITVIKAAGRSAIVFAPLIEDNLTLAMYYNDLSTKQDFELIENVRKIFSDAIGKEAGVTMYYYTKNQWEAKQEEIDGHPMCRLPLSVIKTGLSTSHPGGRGELTGEIQREHEKLREYSFIDFN